MRLWRQKKEKISKEHPTSRAAGQGRKALLPDLEKELLELVAERRAGGCSISTVEIRLAAQKIAKVSFPLQCWCYNFMKRHSLSVRRKTSIAQRMTRDYEDKLLEFQKFVINLRKRNGYDISNIANADQTPLTFDLPSNQTIDFKGASSVTMKSTGNEKNRFNIMLGAYGDGTKMRPYIIFKRKTLPKNIKWPKGVEVRCHPKGWMDEKFTKDWIYSVFIKYSSSKKTMLVLDAFRCHRMPAIKEILKEDKTDLVIIPGGMTGQLQVMDVSCNRPFKQEMRQRWNNWFSGDEHSFTPSGNMRKPDLCLIATWIKESWDAVSPEIIKKGFKKCCLTNAMDGTEDDVLWEEERPGEERAEEETEDDVVDEGLYGDGELATLFATSDEEEEEEEFEGFTPDDL